MEVFGIVSDRDSKFISHFWNSLFTMLDTKLLMSTAFHPQTNGQSERMIRIIEQALRNFLNYAQDNWEELITPIEFAINNLLQASTGQTPFYLNYGKHPNTPISLLQPEMSTTPAANEFLEKMTNLLKVAKDNLQEAQDQQAKYADIHRSDESFDVGERVWLSTRNLVTDTGPVGPRKFKNPFVGPYRIIGKLSELTYELELPSNLKCHPVFHISQLKKLKENPTKFETRRQPPPPPDIIDDHEEFEVEEIVNKRTRRGKLQYLVKWKGYDKSDNSWEPVEFLENAGDAIEEFEAK